MRTMRNQMYANKGHVGNERETGMIKLILTDIDGTILPYGQSEVDETTKKAFHAALDAGLSVGPCSGRGYAWVPPLFGGDAACCATAIASNGLEVYLNGRVVRAVTFGREELERVAGLVREVPHAGLLCFVDGVPYLVEGTRDDLAVAFPRYAETCKDATGVPEGPVGKANVFLGAGLEETKALVARLNREVEGLDFDVPQPGFSNVMPAGVNKASAIDVLCGALGCTTDEVVVFGDAGNDLPMLRHVPNSVAVSNATPEAAAAARWHVGACEEHAVAGAIAALAAGEWPFVR